MPSWRSASPIFPGSRACLSAYSRGHFSSCRGEGGEERRSKKDTGYLYKALMVARRPFSF
jgi:hypothetical protein